MSRALLDPMADRSLTDQLADLLRSEITSGARPQGSQLPSEREFEQDYGISRTVVRDALDELVLEGIVVKRKGFGSFVREQPLVRRISSDTRHGMHRDTGKPAFDADASLQGRVPSRRILGVERRPVPADIAKWLECDAGTEVVVRRRLQFLDGQPAVISASYYPMWLAAESPLESKEALKAGPDNVIEQLGHRFSWGTEVFRTRMPTPDERRLLKLDAGVPVIRMLHIDYNPDNRPLQVADDLYAGDQHEFAFIWNEPKGVDL